MKPRFVIPAGLLLAALALTALAQDDPEPPYKAKSYKTPQAVFDALVVAMAKQDYRTTIDCYTPEAVKQMAADHAFQGLHYRDQAEGRGFKDKGGKDENVAERYKPILAVLDRHGLTEKATKDLSRNYNERKKVAETVLKLIKKPDVFAVDFMKAMEKVQPGHMRNDDVKPRLADVKIDGDKATGNVVLVFERKDKDKGGTGERKSPVEFRKVGGSWRINPRPERGSDAPRPKDGFKDKP